MILSPVRPHGRDLHSLEGEFVIYARHSLYNGISYRRNARISYHAVGLAAMQMPNRKLALLPVYRQHGVDEILVSFALEDGVERHCSAICVPE